MQQNLERGLEDFSQGSNQILGYRGGPQTWDLQNLCYNVHNATSALGFAMAEILKI